MSHSSLVSAGDFAKVESRRSTRIERSVPLIIFGQNTMGEPFVERTVSVSLNLHGCRYPSRHDYGVGAWITLQVVGLNTDPKPQAVRAQVKSVHLSRSPRELQQVGVELEAPRNVWGVASPPLDWLRLEGVTTPIEEFAAATAPVQEPTTMPETLEEPSPRPEHKLAEVTPFPALPSAAAMPQAPEESEAPKPRRVVITPDGLIKALQGKLQQAAEQAAQAAVSKQIDEAVRRALRSIDEVRQSSIREVQELFPARVEAMRLTSKEEILGEAGSRWKEQIEAYRGQVEATVQRLEIQAAELRGELAKSQEFVEKMTREIEPQIHSRLNAALNQAASDFEGAAARAVDRRYERLLENTQAVTQEALLKLDARFAEVQALVQSAVNSALGAFQRQAESYVSAALSEAKERAASSLSAIDAQSRAACEARRQALESEVARATERSTEQFRTSMKAFLYSCLVAAVSAVDEHSKSTLDGLRKDNGETLRESGSGSGLPEDPGILPGSDIDPLTH